MTDVSRRVLLGKTLVSLPALGLAWRAAAAGATPPAASGKFVADTDPTAKALQYVADGTKATKPKKGNTEGKDQSCANCQFFAKGADIEGKPAGKCLMIASGQVHPEGWCISWVKKA